jgi:hypothetical protein
VRQQPAQRARAVRCTAATATTTAAATASGLVQRYERDELRRCALAGWRESDDGELRRVRLEGANLRASALANVAGSVDRRACGGGGSKERSVASTASSSIRKPRTLTCERDGVNVRCESYGVNDLG